MDNQTFDTTKYLQLFEEDTGCKISAIASKLRLQSEETKEKNWQTFSKNKNELTTFIEIYTIVMGIVAYTLKSNQILKKPSQNSLKALTSKLITKLPKPDNNERATLTKSEYMNNLHHLLNEIHDEIQEGTTEGVDRLVMMFPSIERPTIKNILVNECQGDTTKSIVILTRVQQFNQSMNNANVNQDQTNNSGESQTIKPTEGNVDSNNINIASATNTIQAQVEQPQPMQTVVVYQDAKQREDYIKQQMKLNNGNCWRIILIVLWSLSLLACVGLILYALMLFFFIIFFLPVIVEAVSISFCIYGVSSYKYSHVVFGCAWSGIHVLLGFLAIIFWSILHPPTIMYIVPPLIYFSCIFACSIILKKKIAQFGERCECLCYIW